MSNGTISWLLRQSLIVLLLSLIGCSQQYKFNHVDITGSSSFSPKFELADHHGKLRKLEDFNGKVVLVFFGFTQCPDVCPSTMIDFKKTLEDLGSKADQVQVLFITLDPERDSQEILSAYVPGFDRRFLGLRPSNKEELDQIIKSYRIFYQKVPNADKTSYTIDHTAASFVIDPKGQLRLYVKHGHSTDLLVKDIQQLLR